MRYQWIFISLLACSLQGQSHTTQTTKDVGCSPGNMTGAAPELLNRVGRFLKELQTAVAGDDRAGVASLAHYPIVAAAGKKMVVIRTREEFVQQYDQIFTPRLTQLLADQKAGCVNLMDGKGFMLADGEIWFNEYSGGRLMMSTINPPPPIGD